MTAVGAKSEKANEEEKPADGAAQESSAALAAESQRKKEEAAPADEHTKDNPALVGESNDDDRGEDYALEAWLARWSKKAAVAAEVRV